MSGNRPRAILAASFLACSTGLADDWVAYTTENFTLYSDAHGGEIRELLQKFELFRHTTLTVLALPDEPENQRLVIIVYSDTRDFDRVSPPRVAGFFYSSIFGPRMFVRSYSAGITVQETLFHEYVHYLMSQRSRLNYPRWYREGLATVLQSTEISYSTIRVGRPPETLAPPGFGAVDQLVGLDARGGPLFYRDAWLFTHYLLFGNPERRRQSLDYLRRYDAGEDPIEAFAASFGISPKEMSGELSSYARQRRIRGLQGPRIEYAGELSTRPLEPDEALLLLGDIAVELDEHDAAHYYFDKADELEGESPYRANFMSRRAIALIHEQRVDEGDELMSRLLAQPVEDPQVLGDIAHYAFDRFVEIRTKRADGSETAELDRAVDYGLRAVEADPGNLEAHYYLGLSHEARGELQRAADALLNGYDIDPSSADLNRDLARVLIKGRQHELASYLLSRVYSTIHSEAGRTALQEVIDDLEDGDADLERHQELLPPWEKEPEASE